MRSERRCPRLVGQFRLDVEQLEDLLQGRHPRLVGGVELGELLDRFDQVGERRHERDDCAGCDVSGDRLVTAVQHDPRDRYPGEHFYRREIGGVESDRDHVGVAVVLVELGKARQMARLLAEAAHYPDA